MAAMVVLSKPLLRLRRRWVLLLLCATSVGLLLPLRAAAAPRKRTVMAWIEGNNTEVAQFVLRGAGKGAVNAVSSGSVFGVSANSTRAVLTVNSVGLEEHRRIWQTGLAKQMGIRTYPVIGYGGNISGLRSLFQPATQKEFIEQLVLQVQQSDVDGINIDFEPLTDVHHPANNPTIADASQFAEFLQALGVALHALPGRRRHLSMDSESVAGACWSMSGAPGHPWNRKPCPWIRYFWDLNIMSTISELDRVIPMDTYTTNSSEFPYDMWLYQKYFPVDRIGFGLYPTQSWPNNASAATQEFVSSRVDAFQTFGGDWISCWVINPGTTQCPTMSVVEERWAPWIPRFREFLAASTARLKSDDHSRRSYNDPNCTTGLLNDGYCCAASCRRCGSTSCKTDPAGSANCCKSEIKKAGKPCKANNPPCLMPSQVPAPPLPPAPPPPPAHPVLRQATWWVTRGKGPNGGPTNAQWVAKNSGAITRAVAFCWEILDNGTFVVKEGCDETAAAMRQHGVDFFACGSPTATTLLRRTWGPAVSALLTHALDHRWSGVHIDFEEGAPPAAVPLNYLTEFVQVLAPSLRLAGLEVQLDMGETEPVELPMLKCDAKHNFTYCQEPLTQALRALEPARGKIAIMGPTYQGVPSQIVDAKQLLNRVGYSNWTDCAKRSLCPTDCNNHTQDCHKRHLCPTKQACPTVVADISTQVHPMFGVMYDAGHESLSAINFGWNHTSFHDMVNFAVAKGVCEIGIYTCPGCNQKNPPRSAGCRSTTKGAWTRYVAPWMVEEVERFLRSSGPGCTPRTKSRDNGSGVAVMRSVLL